MISNLFRLDRLSCIFEICWLNSTLSFCNFYSKYVCWIIYNAKFLFCLFQMNLHVVFLAMQITVIWVNVNFNEIQWCNLKKKYNVCMSIQTLQIVKLQMLTMDPFDASWNFGRSFHGLIAFKPSHLHQTRVQILGFIGSSKL